MKHFIIKPLEWVENHNMDWEAMGVRMKYTISYSDNIFSAVGFDLNYYDAVGKFKSFDEAKSACESHHREVAESLLESIGYVDYEMISQLNLTIAQLDKLYEVLRNHAKAADEWIGILHDHFYVDENAPSHRQYRLIRDEYIQAKKESGL